MSFHISLFSDLNIYTRFRAVVRDGINFSQRHRVIIPLTFRKTSTPNMEYKPVSIAAFLLIIFLITLLGYQFLGKNYK